jgi:mono/diheme cytochrome c family protein
MFVGEHQSEPHAPARTMPLFVAVALITVATLAVASSDSATPAVPASPDKVDFARDIEPILATCFECHGEKRRRGGLRLDLPDAARKGGNSGPVMVAGKGDESLLLHRVRGEGNQKRMPLNRDPLTDEQIALLKAWIDQGADYPASPGRQATADQEEKHWSYVPPTRPSKPLVLNPDWCRNEIDTFVLARLQSEGLNPAPEADRATLLRRVYLDLIGLPPTPEEARRFLADQRPDAYERLVDDLLASPHFGERWARPWLDLARYADSNGYEKDLLRTMWPYRDWVINAFNHDMAFDQFTLEQIAGDMLPDATLDQQIASGFNRNTMINEEGGNDPEEYRCASIVDRVNTTATVWLGSTIGCCQCHTHKFDPFTIQEYYQLFAFFNNTAEETYRAPDNDVFDKSPKLRVPLADEEAVRARAAALEAALQTTTPEIAAAQAEWERDLATPVNWRVVDPVDFESAGGASVSALRDRSIELGGKAAARDTYSAVLELSGDAVTALRIEVLPSDQSQSRGPGPGRTPHGNFVLTELRGEVGPPSGGPVRKVEWSAAAADHEQKSGNEEYTAARAVDGDGRTGWAVAPEYGKPHFIVFVPREPLAPEVGTRLTLKLEQNYGAEHVIGRLRFTVTSDRGDARRETTPKEIASIVATSAADRTVEQSARLAAHFRAITPLLDAARRELAVLNGKLASAPRTLVMQELPEPRETFVHLRGNFLNRGERVQPLTPAALHPFPSGAPTNRIGLARWLVSGGNPLVGRVTMNRVWEQYFGRGIVATSEDFGVQGEAPTHPELLDWLAVDFAEGGWRFKRMHRQIVLSATYRQSSCVTPELLEKDPYNRLLARGARHRLDAEQLRDQALAVSGLLNRKLGGPSVMPLQPPGIWAAASSGVNDRWMTSSGDDRYRRGIYTFWRRTSPYPSMVTFDAPNREVICTRRPRTNTPLQALTTLNDPEFVAPATALAKSTMDAGGPEVIAAELVRRVLFRDPREAEVTRLVALFEQQKARFKADPIAARKVAQLPSSEESLNAACDRIAAWTMVANVLLNLDETLTKG